MASLSNFPALSFAKQLNITLNSIKKKLLYIYTQHSFMLKSALQIEADFVLLWLSSRGGCGLWRTSHSLRLPLMDHRIISLVWHKVEVMGLGLQKGGCDRSEL